MSHWFRWRFYIPPLSEGEALEVAPPAKLTKLGGREPLPGSQPGGAGRRIPRPSQQQARRTVEEGDHGAHRRQHCADEGRPLRDHPLGIMGCSTKAGGPSDAAETEDVASRLQTTTWTAVRERYIHQQRVSAQQFVGAGLS